MSAITWPDLPAVQQPAWPDAAALEEVLAELRAQPPLVFAGECDILTDHLGKASRGEAFVLTGGDCAETFAANTADSIRARLKTVLQMSVVLTYAASLPVIKVGRVAGQYFKPRSNPMEVRDGVELPSYLGDAVNALDFTLDSRQPDPRRLLRAYHASGSALNLIRAFTQGGYADLRQVHAWNQDFVRDSTAGQLYERLAAEIDRALSFMHACGANPEEFARVEFYAAHEALSLDYERALTRVDSRTGELYDVSGHFLWVGERTRQLDGAHMHFAASIRNPVGMKVGPTASPEDVLEAVERLNPDRIPGRLSLITRMGAGTVRDALPAIVQKVEASGHPVVWVCDPMHGNTREASSGHKTRSFDDVIAEVEGFFDVHRRVGTIPGGIHVELTGDDVTECVGGTHGVAEDGLGVRYETACDPRLNREQSLELSFLVADMLLKR
ncbi:MAG: 3-deoxy-7-phosphoheptulonate synthase class II [Candidatus Nanopelagicales bacterium]|mgnify:FL=1|jgi:3-deoxy-7-phosphoheptulonate synthase|nr:3-deoxy-7-phosphoheptulonate synthase class II [Candidatus Nanopelagicales bacterium]MDP4715797.1 3-deoxy-7-phosphoheptulonate synthase class II [Candidatus Nanopelagicales bacterium]MDP4907697.1 3-deoxy-7-phosphoheptulonate synthase class II [Candidatus Nanopelagicales bacterium]MDP4975690.1 3-deoxy-7-phosphoheptulonate synthase class II [Candidatus Nanopelagicales bacterium]MDP5095195.1 3-deoxy-7-phosphoheptulonate synthase class II [Candidatus Nanopelagicales bacterium]